MSDNKKQKSYEAYILEIANEVCEKNEHPICVEYERKIAELKSKESTYGIKYEVKDVHSRVYRVLNQLVKKGEFFLAEKCYYPNIPKYRRKGYGQLIKKKLRLEHSEVHRVSENTCIVPVTRYMVGNNHYITDEEVIELFEMYIGKANCYKLKIIDNILVIMLRKGICEDETTIDDIESLVKEIANIKKRINQFEKKELIRRILKDEYSYYWFDKCVIYENEGGAKRFLFLSYENSKQDDMYAILTRYFHEYDDLYPGFNGIVLVFDITTTTEKFDKFISYIKRRTDDGNDEK